MPNPDSNSAAYEPSKYKNLKPPKIYLTTNETTGFTFQGPLTVADDSKKDPKAPREKREKKICRQFAVDLTLTGDRPPVPESLYEVYSRGSLSSKQSSFEKSALSLQSIAHNSAKQSTIGRTAYQKNNSRQLSLEKPHKQASTKSEGTKPKFSRSATLEWTFEGPSSHIPSSDWIDSFTRQHGLATSSSSQQRRSSFIKNDRSSLDNPKNTIKHRVLSKSPSAPTQDLNSRSIKDYGSTNSSFEHHPSDPIPPATETRVLVHNLPSEGLRKHEKSSGWSKKLGITGSQFLTTNWTSSSKRSPTYPLISPSSQSQPSFDPSQESSRNSESTSIELIGRDLEVPPIDFCLADYKTQGKLLRSSSSATETSWITGNQSSPHSAQANPLRRRIPVTKLHRSPSRSNRFTPEMSDTVVEVNSTSGSGWLSIARNQRAKIKKCRALGKLYTTVKVEDDDVSVLVTTD